MLDGLFVNDSDSFFWEKDAPDIMEEVENNIGIFKRTFRLIFVFCYHDIYLIDTKSGDVVHKEIGDDEIQVMVMSSLNALGRSIL